jgi:uncharacterized protein with HEPN domain
VPGDNSILLDVIRAAELSLVFRGKKGKKAFIRDLKTQSAVLHQLLILGEAVKRLSPGFREKHADIPWKMIAGMRNALIHEYGAVDLEEAWKTLESDVPRLLAYVKPLAPKRNG